MMTLNDYKNAYIRSNYRFLPDGQYCNPNKRLNDERLEDKYNKYVKRLENKKLKGNSKYMQSVYDVEAECRKENPQAEFFYSNIRKFDEKNDTDFEGYFRRRNKALGDIYDPAHIFPRGTHPELSTEKDNIIILPRFVHSLLDADIELFSEDFVHRTISKERKEEIWNIILGEDNYNRIRYTLRNKIYGK